VLVWLSEESYRKALSVRAIPPGTVYPCPTIAGNSCKPYAMPAETAVRPVQPKSVHVDCIGLTA
jgi:hypothetical protein